MKIRVGFGYDVHKLVAGRDLWLGGIKIDHAMGLLGHSDADVLIHAICDALLGAANMRDIGYHFPDTSASTLNIDSKILLKQTVDLIATKGYVLGNVDATVCAEHPKLNPHIPAMKSCLAEVIGTDEENISINRKEKNPLIRIFFRIRVVCGLPKLSRGQEQSNIFKRDISLLFKQLIFFYVPIKSHRRKSDCLIGIQSNNFTENKTARGFAAAGRFFG